VTARPTVDDTAWIAPGAVLVHDVSIGAGASVWYTAVLRGDGDAIVVGEGSNVQDGAVVHSDPGFPVTIGTGVTIGHRAVVHGCTVADDVLVGIGAVLLNGSRIGPETLVAAGAVVLEGADIPAGSLVAGVPAKVRRELSDEERASIRANAAHYRELAAEHVRYHAQTDQ
jgi:carbonic anhydrase/acetyltransferase-like protein (isoleucine patch superfamily)